MEDYTMKKVTQYFLVFIIGVLPGYFVIFNSIFTDSSGSVSERLLTFLLAVVSYGIPGAILGFMGPATSWRWGVWLTLPALAIVLLYSFREPALMLLNFSYIILAFASGAAAAYMGASFALRKKESSK